MVLFTWVNLFIHSSMSRKIISLSRGATVCFVNSVAVAAAVPVVAAYSKEIGCFQFPEKKCYQSGG